MTPKHDVWQRPDNGKYWCRNCSFTTDSTDLAIAHKRIPLTDAQASQVARPQAQQLPVSNAYGFGKSAAVHSPAAVTTAAPSGATATIPAPPTAAEFKACPDCAEEVRAAANKCRFCGYRFDASTNSDATASALGPGLKRS